MNIFLLTTLFITLSYAIDDFLIRPHDRDNKDPRQLLLSDDFFESGFDPHHHHHDPNRKSGTSSRRWQRKTAKTGSCRRAKCPNNDDYCVKPKCYPRAEIDRVLHEDHNLSHPHPYTRSGNCLKSIFLFFTC